MRHKKAATGAAAVLALGIGATAVAAPGGDGPLGRRVRTQPAGAPRRAGTGPRQGAQPARGPRAAGRSTAWARSAAPSTRPRRPRSSRSGWACPRTDAAKALAKGREALRKEFQSQRSRRNFRPRGGPRRLHQGDRRVARQEHRRGQEGAQGHPPGPPERRAGRGGQGGPADPEAGRRDQEARRAGRVAHALPPPPRRAGLRPRRTRWARRTAAWGPEGSAANGAAATS